MFNKLNIFDEYVLQIIHDFAGTKQYWKSIYSEQVMTKINKGWKLVCLPEEGNPCLNCYAFGNGIDIPCLSCIIYNQNMHFWMSYDDYIYVDEKNKHKSLEVFKKECENQEYFNFKMLLESDIQNHPIIKYNNILNIV